MGEIINLKGEAMKNVTVQQWKELFKGAGLNEEQMKKWHCLFEKNYPDGHRGFLEWLKLDEASIKKIREQSK